jgi:DNA-directed RNA polymerase subunit RPC12/RpoP
MIYKNGKMLHWLDGENESKANWMRYVQHANDSHKQNVEAFQNDGKLYFKATKDIQECSELIVKYGNPQCSVLVMAKNICDVVDDGNSVDCEDILKCADCNILYTSEVIYHRHMRVKHCKGLPLPLYEMEHKERVNKQTKEDPHEDNVMLEEDYKPTDTVIELPAGINLDTHSLVCPIPSKMKTRSLARNDKSRVTKRKCTKSIVKRPLVCSVCDQGFTTVCNLRKHEMIHSNERPHACPTCDRAFTQKSNMVAHMKTHTDNKKFVCPHCGKGFYRQSELRKHEKFHSAETPYVCTDCGKGFKEVSNLKRHLRSHTGEKPYRCPICSRDFSRSENLKTHMKRHTGEKPFQCSLCGTCFAENAHLQPHLSMHTSEKPFPCFACDKAFVDITGLKVHSKTHIKK